MVLTAVWCLSDFVPRVLNMRRHGLKVLFIFLALILVLSSSVSGYIVYQLFYRPMINDKDDLVTLQVDKATTASSFVHLLEAKHLIQSGPMLLAFIRLQGLSPQLKAGMYQIRIAESAGQFVYRVVKGDVIKESFSIIEGTTQAIIAKNLQQANFLSYNEKDWLAISGIFSSAEGLLLADTYQYDAGSQSMAILRLAHANLERFLQQSWQHRTPGLPYKTPYELLIAASILEKETAIPKEKRLISGIIANRLQKNMPLQMDPTVIYALGQRYQGKLTREDLHVDSPYNSYRYRGLPPTPIAMVGKDAIEAAAHPELTDYLYFVATGDGHHYFSVNYEQQKQAVARYRRDERL